MQITLSALFVGICRKYYVSCSSCVQNAINPKLHNMNKHILATGTSLPKLVFFQGPVLQNGYMFLISHVMTRLRRQALIFTYHSPTAVMGKSIKLAFGVGGK